MKKDNWIVEIKGTNEGKCEISVIKDSYFLGLSSWGWEDNKNKIIIYDKHLGKTLPIVWDNIIKMANNICKELNSKEKFYKPCRIREYGKFDFDDIICNLINRCVINKYIGLTGGSVVFYNCFMNNENPDLDKTLYLQIRRDIYDYWIKDLKRKSDKLTDIVTFKGWLFDYPSFFEIEVVDDWNKWVDVVYK